MKCSDVRSSENATITEIKVVNIDICFPPYCHCW